MRRARGSSTWSTGPNGLQIPDASLADGCGLSTKLWGPFRVTVRSVVAITLRLLCIYLQTGVLKK